MDTYSSIHTCFEQPSKDLSKPYCVYITFYRGKLLPPFYIGSGKTKDVLDGKYKGTVLSKKYKVIWMQELKINRNLFESKVLCTFTNRLQATLKENKLQTNVRAVKNSLYINLCYANKKFGMNITGKNNPFYGKKHSAEAKEKNRLAHLGKKYSEETNRKKSLAQIGRKMSPESIEKAVMKRALTYEIITPSGETLIIKNLAKFCRENNLDQRNMSKVVNGLWEQSKGFRGSKIG